MKTCLYLYTKSSEDVVFWQMLDYTINLKEGDIFESFGVEKVLPTEL